MKKTFHLEGAAGSSGNVDLIRFAWHMQETARTAAARRLFGQFLQSEIEQRQKNQAVLTGGVSYDCER